MISEAKNLFLERFGTEASWFAFAPGRVNLIGEHTDYNGGFVFPAAIDRGVFVALALSNGSTELTSKEMGEGESFDSTEIGPGQAKGWASYPAGVAWALRDLGPLPNIKAAVVSNLPTGSGLSSSAAIEMAFAVAWNHIAGLGLENKDLALRCQRAENESVGVNCGVMDQMASAMGKQDHAMFLDTRSLEIQFFPIPKGLSLVICDTGKKRALTDSSYNERRSQCQEACKILGIESLRDANLALLEQSKSALGDLLYCRAMHVVTENQRCVDFAHALGAEDLNQVGSLMRGSHNSLRNNYQVSAIELDNMVSFASDVEGCIGARMTGAGFGGACIALVKTEAVPGFIYESNAKYRKSNTAYKPSFMECKAVDGARILDTLGEMNPLSEISGQAISKTTEDVE